MLVLLRKKIGKFVPASLRSFLLRHFSVLDERTSWWESKDPYKDEPPYSTYESPYPFTVGIFKEIWHRHIYLVAACKELKISYKLIDINAPDWIEQVKESKCVAFFYHPSVQLSIWKEIYDERLKYMADITSAPIFPKYEEMFMYESKRRMAYWLETHGVPHAKTYVFYNKVDALKYVETANMPIVAKTNMGARAAGVEIFHSRNGAMKYVKQVFSNGIVHADGDRRDADWGCAIFQDYIETPYEWRVIKIGNAYFAHQKLKKGDYCSGSGRVGWVKPPEQLLDFVRDVAAKSSIETADIDVFEDNGQYFVNEIQAFWGWIAHYQMLVNGIPGYYRYLEDVGKWEFVEGIFCRNGGCNFRIITALKSLGFDIEYDFSSLGEKVDQDDYDSSVQSFRESEAQH
ncbi:MAG: carbamoyl phosphate synthase-like protein [Lentisphaerae bacterium ADurb.Bin082]|nr:MAG: carbamoyl phosphate synthase-like protein [Lentisphaerae bacterium ADurb.Bin082]